ncbi:hypothetical protein BC829DRAFT_173692 [Chytridium lagenaria]|nr:hypothetical protein BC829DRAFT_173692 [Chytridium lagenaria]
MGCPPNRLWRRRRLLISMGSRIRFSRPFRVTAAPPVASTSTAFEAPISIADSLWKSVKYGVTTSVFGGLKTEVVPVVVNPLVESVKDDMKTSASKPTATSSVEVARNDVKASLVGASKGVLALKPIADSVLESMKDDVKPSLFGGPKIASKPFTDSLFGSVREEVKPSLFGAPKSVVASVEESRVESGKDMKLLGAPKTSIASVADSLFMSVKDDVKPSLFRGSKNYADSLLKSVNDDAKPLLFEVQKTSIAPKSVADSLFESVKEDLKPSLFAASKVVTAPKSVANSIFQIVKDDVKSVVPISREMKPVVAPTSFADLFLNPLKMTSSRRIV